jgi:hypothetical protein
MPHSPYVPLPLTPYYIRILELCPSLVHNSPIRCRLKSVRLGENTPPFEAISYAWGDQTERRQIWVESAEDGGAIVRITTNCWNALRSLRLATTERTLWIDAVCIDQANDGERTAQVQIMGLIYTAAEQVVVYLGEETSFSRRVFRELKLAEAHHRFDGSGSDPGDIYDRPRPSPAMCAALDDFLTFPWFYRVWVLQEVFNAQDVTVRCGHQEASLATLRDLVFGYCGTKVTQRLVPLTLQVARFVHVPKANAVEWLWEMLFRSRSSLATDPRDKIFALFPMMRHKVSGLEALVNYNDATEKVFTALSIQFLNESQLQLGLLAAARHPHSLDMPSWVPDWSDTRRESGGLNLLRNIWPDQVGGRPCFKILDRECASERDQIRWHTLLVRGAPGPRVMEIGAPYLLPSPEDVHSRVRDIELFIKACAEGWDVASPKNLDGADTFTPGIIQGMS